MRNHHDAVPHGLVVACDGDGREGEVSIAECLGHGRLRIALDLFDAVDRIGARYLCDGVDEIGCTDHAHSQSLDVDYAGHAANRGGRLLQRALRRTVDQRLDRRAGHAQAE